MSYYAPKGKQLGFAFGNTDEFHYTIFINSTDGQPLKVGIMKETFAPSYNIEGVEVNMPLSDVISIIEGIDHIFYIDEEFSSPEDVKKLKDMVKNDHTKITINRRR